MKAQLQERQKMGKLKSEHKRFGKRRSELQRFYKTVIDQNDEIINLLRLIAEQGRHPWVYYPGNDRNTSPDITYPVNPWVCPSVTPHVPVYKPYEVTCSTKDKG